MQQQAAVQVSPDGTHALTSITALLQSQAASAQAALLQQSAIASSLIAQRQRAVGVAQIAALLDQEGEHWREEVRSEDRLSDVHMLFYF